MFIRARRGNLAVAMSLTLQRTEYDQMRWIPANEHKTLNELHNQLDFGYECPLYYNKLGPRPTGIERESPRVTKPGHMLTREGVRDGARKKCLPEFQRFDANYSHSNCQTVVRGDRGIRRRPFEVSGRGHESVESARVRECEWCFE